MTQFLNTIKKLKKELNHKDLEIEQKKKMAASEAR